MWSLKERPMLGKKLRRKIGRNRQADWSPKTGRNDPVATIAAANGNRLQFLLPTKMERMAAGPFAFFRGAAPLMAADLATLPVSDLQVQICGDAHVRNLGAYAAPEGHFVFDINDFDETIAGPWEWDLKRLATSLVHCAGGHYFYSRKTAKTSDLLWRMVARCVVVADSKAQQRDRTFWSPFGLPVVPFRSEWPQHCRCEIPWYQHQSGIRCQMRRRRVRVAAFSFAVAVFAFALVRTAMLPL